MEYVIHLYYISRFVDIGKISAFIIKHIPVTHDLEERDKNAGVTKVERLVTDF